MAVCVYPMEDRRGNMNCFACQTRKSFAFQKSVFTPYLDAEFDDYGKNVFVSMSYPSNAGFSHSRIIDKEKAYCYDRDYATLLSLWKRFANISSDMSLFSFLETNLDY